MHDGNFQINQWKLQFKAELQSFQGEMSGQVRNQIEVLKKTRQALHDTIQEMQQCTEETMPQQSIKFIQMRFQALLIQLRKAKIEIPAIALEPNNPQCLNNFNKKQFPLIENQMMKHKLMIKNFENVGKELQCNEKRMSKSRSEQLNHN